MGGNVAPAAAWATRCPPRGGAIGCLGTAVLYAPGAQLPDNPLGALIGRIGNGLKVLVQPIHAAPLASVWCRYRIGSGDERPGQTGLSQ
jgi:hypothetical protein